MAPWIAALGMSLAQAQQKKQQEEQARRMASSDLSAQYSSSMGYPSYGVQAAKVNNQLEDQYGRQNWMASLIPMLTQGGGG